tara:strand:- start:321 stop:545 length:225 start_codon:yes stop_codon:yes gene_type:complete
MSGDKIPDLDSNGKFVNPSSGNKEKEKVVLQGLEYVYHAILKAKKGNMDALDSAKFILELMMDKEEAIKENNDD